VGDSNLKTLKKKWKVEEALGGKGKLFTPGITSPKEDRSYCSTRDWPEAWYPENSLEVVLPRLLQERPYSSAIILAPTNDITNLKELASPEERRLMASQSSRNTLRIMENALRSFPTLRKIVCVERQVRVDDMAKLSRYSDSELRRLVEASEFSNRILVSANRSELRRTEEEMVAVFGVPNARGIDGIHMRGKMGEQFFTETLIVAAKLAGLSSSGLGGGRQAATGLDSEQESRRARRPQAAAGLDGQHRSQPATWAERAANNRYSVLQSNQSN